VIAKSELGDLFLEMSIVDDIITHVTDFAIRGISFTSRKRGWAFDNVKNFEVSSRTLLILYGDFFSNDTWKSNFSTSSWAIIEFQGGSRVQEGPSHEDSSVTQILTP
jgi:hypothetical protein